MRGPLALSPAVPQYQYVQQQPPPPHDAPRSPAVPPAGDPTGGTEFSIGASFEYTKNLFLRHWLFLTLFMVVYFGGSLVGNFIPIVGLFTMFPAVILLAGTCQAVVEAERRHEQVDFVAMFSGFKTIRGLEIALELLAMSILFIVASLPAVLGIAILIFAANQTSAGISSIVSWVASFGFIALSMILIAFIQIRMSLAFLVSLEKIETEKFDPIASINTSWSMTRGHTLQLFVIWLVVSLVSLLSVLALCVGYFLVAPQLSAATIAATYLLLLPPSQRGGRFADITTCPWCGYSLEGTDGPQCPECGKEHPARVVDGEPVFA